MENPVPTARLRLPDGRVREVAAGSILGRLASAACRLDDPRVSEAHALLSHRGGRLVLLALRGALAVDGALCREITLAPGQRIALAEDVTLTVLALSLPRTALALQLPDGRLAPLAGEVASLVRERALELVPRFIAGSEATFWSTGSGWRVAQGDARPAELLEGAVLRVGDDRVEVVAVPAAELAVPATRGAGRLHPPIRLAPAFTSVRLEVEGRPPVLIGGVPGRILSELCEFPEPVEWRLVASQVWPDEDDAFRLRKCWDRNLRTLRDQLAAAGLRQDLVRLDGHGNVGLHLLDGDALAPST